MVHMNIASKERFDIFLAAVSIALSPGHVTIVSKNNVCKTRLLFLFSMRVVPC